MDKTSLVIGAVIGLIIGYIIGATLGIYQTERLWRKDMVSQGYGEYVITDSTNGTAKFIFIPMPTNKIDKGESDIIENSFRLGEVYGPAMEMKIQQDADQYFKELAKHKYIIKIIDKIKE